MTPREQALRLFGTSEVAAPTRRLTAGKLSALLDAGNLRDIRFDGVEVIRGVSFLLRDVEWGTASTEISGLKIKEGPDRFTVTYRAACSGVSGFVYDARIEGLASGKCSFHAEGTSVRDFQTNRVGFVVLHPLRGVAGRLMTIEHVDGSAEAVTMPELISPDQPAFAIRALSHEPVDGLRVTCRLEGDTFEMEDQRNWTDASFKTYVRPVAQPRPFTVSAGERVGQSVTITMSGQGRGTGANSKAGGLRVGEIEGTVPAIALGVDALEIDEEYVQRLAALAPPRLVARLDLREQIPDRTLARLEAVRASIGATLTLELVLPARDPETEITVVAEAVAASGLHVDAVLPTGAYDLKMRPSNTSPSDAASQVDLVRSARRAFPHASIGGGMLTGFPEFNRNPPPEGADFVTHTTSAIVHAADDRSVMETIEALPYVFASARAHGGKCPYRIGRSGIGMRINPAGSSTAGNPHGGRVAMAKIDPRQAGLFAAAWTLAYVAEAAGGGVEEVALADLSGPFGVLDDGGGLRPVFHILRGLARRSGSPSRHVLDMPEGIAVLAADGPLGMEVWLANLTPSDIRLGLDGIWKAAVLDADALVEAGLDPAFLDRTSPVTGSLTMAPYSVVRIRSM